MTPVTSTAGGPAQPVRAGGAAGAAGGGGLPMAMTSSVQCGTATCMGFMVMGFGAAACCADEATSSCGNLMGGTCMPKPAAAPLCPMLPSIMGIAVTSCCRPDNTCGVDASAFGMGCGTYAGLARFGGTPPPPTNCDGTPAAPTMTATAGAGAAGTTAAAAGATAAAGASAAAAGASAAAGSSAAAAGAKAAAGASAQAGSSAAAGGGAKAGAGGMTGGAAGAAGR